ncbi:MAG TPA: GAP family protein [Actinocrinis sp.]|nr:GAP family protein [Actinocrinis sp.]
MGEAIGGMLSSAVGVAISPLPIILLVLLLATPRGRADGIAFAAGWVVSLAVVSTLIVVFGGGERTGGGAPATWTYYLKLAIGVLFLLLAVKQWRGRPRPGHEPKQPGWMATVDSFTPVKAAGTAVALAVVSPKNLPLTIGAAVSIASSDAGGAGQAVAVTLFVVLASACVLVPLGVYLLGGDKASATLDGWKTWMAAHNNAIMATIFLVLGVKSIGEAIAGL